MEKFIHIKTTLKTQKQIEQSIQDLLTKYQHVQVQSARLKTTFNYSGVKPKPQKVAVQKPVQKATEKHIEKPIPIQKNVQQPKVEQPKIKEENKPTEKTQNLKQKSVEKK